MKKQHQPFWFLTIIGLTLFLFILNGCKDTNATHEAGKLESCSTLIDEKDWTSAIDICGEVKTDEGYHLTAQAYMGRAGITLFSLLNSLTATDADVSSIMFSYIPDTTSDANDYQSALQYLLTNIQTKSQTVYLESLILSGLLVFKELKTLLELSVTDGIWTTCAGSDSSQDIRNCSWGPQYPDTTDTNSGSKIIFGGLGSDFYTNLCGATSHDSSFDNTYLYTINAIPGIVSETTVDSCSIAADSVLDYNRTAYAHYTGSLKSSLASLYYYEKFDSGENFEATSDSTPTISFCYDPPYIEKPDASDDNVSDCEMLYYLMNPNF